MLTNRQLLTISHIIASPSLEEARRKARLSKGTLYAWIKEDDFKAELKRQRSELVKDATNRLKGAMNKAVTGLIELMDNPKPEFKRLVCKDILEQAFKGNETEELEERIEKLECLFSEKK